MKKALQRWAKRVLAVGTALVITASAAPIASAAFGPSRTTRNYNSVTTGFDHVTFNSFTNVPGGVGDERDFMRGVQVGRDSVWSDPVNNVEQNAEVEAKIYIHNGADGSLNDASGNPGIARNVRVRVTVPTGSKQGHEATAYISADNATPGTVYDTLTMNGKDNGFFELSYVAGSAKLHKDGASIPLTSAQEQALLGSGVNIGDIKGCFEFVQEITFRMKVKMPRYTITKQVALPGEKAADWRETATVKEGDTVSWLITFKNMGATELKNVKIVDEIPAGLTVVPGTVKLVNGNYPSGYIYPASAVQAKGRQINIDIGNYNPGAAGVAYVSFRTKVDKREKPVCEVTNYVNKAFATPNGYGAIWDTANAKVRANATVCEKPAKPAKVMPKTGAGSILGIFASTTAGGALAHKIVLSRRKF